MNEQLRQYRWHQTERIKGANLSQLGRVDEAVVCLENAVQGYQRLLETGENTSLAAHIHHDLGMALFDLGYVHYERSDMLAAQRYMLESLAIWRKVRTNFLELAKLLNAVGYFHYQCGEYQEAWLSFQEANEYYKLLEADSNYVYLLGSMGDLQLDLDEWDAAEQTYHAGITLGKTLDNEYDSFSCYLGLSKLETIRGNYERAMQHLRDAARVRKLGSESTWYQSWLGEILLEMGQFDLAIEALQDTLRGGEAHRFPPQESVLAAFWLGKACFAKGQPSQALSYLENCLKGAARLGYDQFLVTAGRRALPFLRFAAKSWPDYPQLRSLIGRIDSFKAGLAQFQNEPLVTEVREIRLEILAFGNGQVRRNGQLIPKTDWQSIRARALIFYLAERGSANNNELKLNFWPEFNTSKATTNLQSTLWKARKALGGKEIVMIQGEEYLIAPQATVWYDVAEFREKLNRAANLDISPFEQAELWRRAIELYRGDYLDDIPLEWTDALRNELQTLYVETLIHLADWEMERGRFVGARNFYETAIQKEPYRDDIHLALIKCLLRSGAPSAAEAHFLKYKQFLAESGLEPSSELLNYVDNST